MKIYPQPQTFVLVESGRVAGGDAQVEDPDHQGGGGQGKRSEIIFQILFQFFKSIFTKIAALSSQVDILQQELIRLGHF